MVGLWFRGGICFILLLALAAPAAAQEANRGQSAEEIRNELRDLLNRWYPPTVRGVLQLDPSLLRSDDYLKTYPRLAEFLKLHPEVASNPAYFVGTPPEPEVQIQYRRSDAEDIITPIAVLSAFLGSILFVTWLIRSFVDHRRWLRISRLQTEAHSKILERFGSNEDLLTFIQTPAGKRFLESSAVPVEPKNISAPVGRILWSIQVGFVLLFAGLGMELLSYAELHPELAQALFVVGGLVLAMGLGFLFSGIASYALSKRFGLFPPTEGTATGGIAQ
jgi:hypothetical protein